MGDDRRKTEATLVAERLRGEIVRGHIRPAEKLKLAPLSERYGTGRGPLREAASRLAAEQLLVFEDHRGFRVSPISREDLLDVTWTRRRIEALALRDAVLRGDVDWEAGVMAALHALSKASNLDPSPEGRALFSERHRAFHDALCVGCTSSYLLHFRKTLYAHSERYRALAEHQYRRDAKRGVPGEHTAIARAAIERRPDEACALLEAHIERTANTLLSVPGLFGVNESQVSTDDDESAGVAGSTRS